MDSNIGIQNYFIFIYLSWLDFGPNCTKKKEWLWSKPHPQLDIMRWSLSTWPLTNLPKSPFPYTVKITSNSISFLHLCPHIHWYLYYVYLTYRTLFQGSYGTFLASSLNLPLKGNAMREGYKRFNGRKLLQVPLACVPWFIPHLSFSSLFGCFS